MNGNPSTVKNQLSFRPLVVILTTVLLRTAEANLLNFQVSFHFILLMSVAGFPVLLVLNLS